MSIKWDETTGRSQDWNDPQSIWWMRPMWNNMILSGRSADVEDHVLRWIEEVLAGNGRIKHVHSKSIYTQNVTIHYSAVSRRLVKCQLTSNAIGNGSMAGNSFEDWRSKTNRLVNLRNYNPKKHMDAVNVVCCEVQRCWLRSPIPNPTFKAAEQFL